MSEFNEEDKELARLVLNLLNNKIFTKKELLDYANCSESCFKLSEEMKLEYRKDTSTKNKVAWFIAENCVGDDRAIFIDIIQKTLTIIKLFQKDRTGV